MNSAPGGTDTALFDLVHPGTGQVDQPDNLAADTGPQDAYLALDKLIAVVRQVFPMLQPVWEHAAPADVSQVPGKKSFLVFKHNRYTTINTDDIAYIYMLRGSATIVTYKEQQFSQARSLDQIQTLLSPKDFFRVNRQYLVSFRAIKEVEHYSARKLLVNLVIPSPEQLLIAKEKTRTFLQWMDCR